MDDRTKKALLGSIEKWRTIVYRGGKDLGPQNCPLCNEFLRFRCMGCPVYMDTRVPGCGSTPYGLWADHHAQKHSGHVFREALCSECMSLAKKELEFLESLLPKEREPWWEYLITRPEGIMSKMSGIREDRELQVMESRVKAAMEKCPAGKEVLKELFYPATEDEWVEFKPTVKFLHDRCEHPSNTDGEFPYIRYDGWNLWKCFLNGWRRCPSVPFEFKYEHGKFWKRNRDES